MSKVKAKMQPSFFGRQKTKKPTPWRTPQLLRDELSLPGEGQQILPSLKACQATAICCCVLSNPRNLLQGLRQFLIGRVCVAPGFFQLLRTKAFRKLSSSRLLIG